MEFTTQFTKHPRVRANSGSGVKVLYTPRFDEAGNMDLVESGRENLYDFIQSHADSCNIHLILERFARGDVSVLSRTQGSFGDFTDMPGSYAELLNTVISGEQYFMGLPIETRAKFDHSFQKWLVSSGSAEWLEKMGVKLEPEPTTQTAPSVEPPAIAVTE